MMKFYQTRIDPKERQVARFLGDVERAFQRAFTEAKMQRKLTQQQIAVALGIDRSAINRRLLGRENMTERSIAEMAWAMGYDIEFKLVRREEMQDAENTLAAE